MSKAANMAKVSAKGGFHLLWGLVASTVISSIGTIFVANLLGAANYGLYTIALVAPGLISLFRDWGVSSAMIKYTAQYNAEDKAASIRSIFTAGILFETILGITLTVVAFLLSGSLAKLYSLPNITPLIQIASFTILTGALLSTAQSAFTGIEKMELNSVTYVCQAIVKTIVCPVLVIVGLGPLGAVIGMTTASLIAGLIGVLLMWTLYRSLRKPAHSKLEIMATIKTMLNYGLPLSISAIISSIQVQFYSFILPIFVRPDLIGNYGIASSFVVLITFFSTPVTTVLFPAFSKLDPQKDRETLKNVFQFSIKYASLFVVPVAFIVITLSQPGISVLFPKYTAAPLFLALLATNYLYTAFGVQSISPLINGQGQTRFYLILTIIPAAIGFPLSVILIPRFGVIGLIITALVDGCPGLIVALWWIRKHYGVTVDWASSVKILLSSATASAATYTIISIMPSSNLIKLIIGAIIFTVILVIVTLLTKAINRSDVNNMRDMLTELGPFQRLFNFLLNIIEKLMAALQR
jgi:O-antigen/teichoic acid export membrane protein